MPLDTGLATIIDEAFITDRNNRDMVPLGDALVAGSVHTDADIDRAGSKRTMEISAQHGALKAGMWIAPFRTIIPEDGPIRRYQRGHYKLGVPGVLYDGSVLMDVGTPASHQTARGLDIIDDICGAPLQFTFYTPVNGRIMYDCVNLIQIATMGRIGPNLVTNGSFESGSSGWVSVPQGSGGASLGWVPGADVRPAPDGTRTALLTTAAGAANGTGGLIYQDVNIPAGTRYMMLSAVAMCALPTRYVTRMRIEWRNSDGEISRTQTAAFQNGFWGEWQREVVTAAVPTGATFARVVFFVSVTNGGAGYPGDSAVIDDVQLRAIQRLPIDRSRINLPRDTTVATTRIQTMQGESIGYQAINADRMTATGHHAINTDLTGVIVTSRLRDADSGIPKRFFGPGDIVDGVVDMPTVSTDIPNVFIAVKESFEEGVAPMFAFAYNENPTDPYSIHNAETLRMGNEILVQDAVSQAELQAAADAARDRFSVQETIRFRIHPDYDLTIYDLIAIDDPDMPNANGTWAVESIADDGPLMVIGARRVLGGDR